MKVDLDELAAMVDAKLADLKEEIAALQRKQAKLQEQRSQVESIRAMVSELLGALNDELEPAAEVKRAIDTESKEESSSEDACNEVRERAYLKAEEEGFGGNPEQHWSDAQREAEEQS